MRVLGKLNVILFGILIVCISCSDTDSDIFTAEEMDYFNENMEYIRQKKAEKDDDGNLLYKQIVVSRDTILFRLLNKEGEGIRPQMTDSVRMDLKGDLINGTNFQPDTEMTYTPSQLINGVCYTLLECAEGETVESIIPASLGYNYANVGTIPPGSTLIFTFTINEVIPIE